MSSGTLYEFVSLMNVSNITFKYQCCDTFCTFPGETCDRSRQSFCICQPCSCNDSGRHDGAECQAACNIAKFRNLIIKESKDENEKSYQDCDLITKLGITSFCGNVIGIIILVVFIVLRHCRKGPKGSQASLKTSAEMDRFLRHSDSGINYESGEETESGKTLRDFNTRRILTNTANDENRPSQVLISGRRHGTEPVEQITEITSTMTKEID